MTTLPEIDLSKCNGCGDCRAECSANVIDLIGGKAALVRPERCNYCTECELVCRTGAIRCPYEIWSPRNRP